MTAEEMEVEASHDAAPSASSSPSPHSLLEQTREAMEDVAARMLLLKKEGGSKSALRGLVTEMSLRLVSLRQVNRTILVEEDRVKVETEAAKAPVGSTMLQLQNRLYEKNHYLKAIKACRNFQSKYPAIELAPEDEFHRLAPTEIREAPGTTADPGHDLMLKRLSFELFQRKELCKLHKKLEERKSNLLETIMKQKQFLSSLPSQLKSLKRASLPAQEHLGMLHTKKLKQHHTAYLLPAPLYIAYSQLLAQKEAFEDKIELEIVGSSKDAQKFLQLHANKGNGLPLPVDNNKTDDDMLEEEDDRQTRRSKSKKNLLAEPDASGDILQVHPLKIVLKIYDDKDTSSKLSEMMVLKFEYLVKLNVVCVGLEHADGFDNILGNLFPDDTGTELPHQMSKLSSNDNLNFGEKSSRPYKWAQHLAGIDFLQESPLSTDEIASASSRTSDVSTGLSLYRRQRRASTILQRLRSRKRAQLALMEQINFLRKLSWPPLGDVSTPWVSHTPSCIIHSWSMLRYDQHSSSPSAVATDEASVTGSHGVIRDGTPRDGVESMTEDGELLGAVAEHREVDVKTAELDASLDAIDQSRSMSLMSKNARLGRSNVLPSFSSKEDDLELMLDSESDLEEQVVKDEQASQKANPVSSKAWVDHAAKEYVMILHKNTSNNRIYKLEAKIKISIEYPLRPPVFRLRLLTEGSLDFKWCNELCTMEAEVNLNILKVLPTESENFTLANQVRCLAMLLDLYFDEGDSVTHRKVVSVTNVGLGAHVAGTMLARPLRGRDRRKMIYWSAAADGSVLPSSSSQSQ